MTTAYSGPISGVCHGIYDGPHATPPEPDPGPVFLDIKNTTDDGRLDLSEICHVSEELFPKWMKRVTSAHGDASWNPISSVALLLVEYQ